MFSIGKEDRNEADRVMRTQVDETGFSSWDNFPRAETARGDSALVREVRRRSAEISPVPSFVVKEKEGGCCLAKKALLTCPVTSVE